MKVLVANRGEIACRILKTLQEMHVASVAVYSDVDAEAPHVFMADESVCLGDPKGYLDVARILEAAQRTGATAIHPGYGFLSQHASFVEACEAAGLVFIGPSADAMRILGDKRSSREAAEQCGVPVIPGAQTCDTLEDAQAAAERVGYPIVLKAAGGGGGKGMRKVEHASALPDAFLAARREAKSAFNDDRMLVERYIFPARHVEVQILADGTKAIVLGERECSLQRRYQKIIEESPCSFIGEETRAGLFASAIRLAEHVGYKNAGTVEFLVGPDGSHYFLEVNTRLQVEHPVTEMRTGLDIVRLQVELAHGGVLPNDVGYRGCALEARLNAEDAYHGFLPAMGQVAVLHWPHRPWLRIDSGVVEGNRISEHYDSMIAKVIVWGATREDARCRLIEALKNTVVLGLTTNQRFLIDVLERDFFIKGATYTTTVEAEAWPQPVMSSEVQALFDKAYALLPGVSHQVSQDADAFSPWVQLSHFRNTSC